MLESIDGRDAAAPLHISRPQATPGEEPLEVVRSIIDQVRLEGDAALVELTSRYDGVRLEPEDLRVDPDVIAKARRLVRPELIDALEVMHERLRTTHEKQRPADSLGEAEAGLAGEVFRPLRRAGIYVPGGRAAYPSSVLMAAVPARVAGVETLAVCSPPGRDGAVPEVVLAACSVAGIDEVYRVGGAQAIAALAFGTETVRPVDKIVGPGNIYVTLAKRAVQGSCGIDSEAGPTEICVIADGSIRPEVIAADLIAQAEHGPHGSHVLITWDPELAERVMGALERQVALHERPDDVENALIEGGTAVLVRDVDQAFEVANAFAPEHLSLMFDGAEEAMSRVRNAGAVFLGLFSPVSAGDYVAGTNHVLPTGGTARWASGLSTRDFMKSIYVSKLDRPALQRLAPSIDALAEAEGLHAHARAVWERLEGTEL
ncbi:MAG: histidinol dehydrogenase [Actinomycetota bacterium]